MRHYVVIYSGGMDSYTLFHSVKARYFKPDSPPARLHALSFDYGQKHVREIDCARRVAISSGALWQRIDLRDVFRCFSGSALLDPAIAVPEGHYTAENMKATVVPGRNTIMLSIAMGYAESLLRDPNDVAQVLYGAHAGDHTIYPDCRPAFYDAMEETIWWATERKVSLRAPFLNLTKSDILEKGIALGLDYRDTWTCYVGGERPCGRCGACVERAEAFAANGMIDPLVG